MKKTAPLALFVLLPVLFSASAEAMLPSAAKRAGLVGLQRSKQLLRPYGCRPYQQLQPSRLAKAGTLMKKGVKGAGIAYLGVGAAGVGLGLGVSACTGGCCVMMIGMLSGADVVAWPFEDNPEPWSTKKERASREFKECLDLMFYPPLQGTRRFTERWAALPLNVAVCMKERVENCWSKSHAGELQD